MGRHHDDGASVEHNERRGTADWSGFAGDLGVDDEEFARAILDGRRVSFG